jgi:hypothetical protein
MRARTLAIPAFLALSLVAASTTDPLPPIPQTVYSRYGPVPVELVKVVECPDTSGTTPTGVIGCYNSKSRKVTLADTLTLRWQQLTLGHEKCHIAMRDVNVIYSDKSDEERVCWIVARYRLGELEGHP